ncbi:MAG: alcohol dehydrogenase catalytic domain-containing protein [Flaviflexus sp.]|uniref:alcohol dehydrogenase catalytic domain-containing protein n=2 Tax=Flaviflexus sp. TaxID=1969482 RepID=UPI003F8E688B
MSHVYRCRADMLAYEYQSDGSLKIVEKDTPTAGEGELVVEVAAAGICGTDLKIARGEHRMYSPGTVRVRGHENVCIVVENRSGQDPFDVGTPCASLSPHQTSWALYSNHSHSE